MLPTLKTRSVGRLLFPKKQGETAVKVAPLVEQAARADRDQALRLLESREGGLTQAEATERLEKHGPNEVGQEKQHGWPWRLASALRNPLVIILSALSILTFATAQETSDYAGGGLMVLMVLMGVALRFVQETRADAAAAKLKAMISVTTMVVRDGQAREIPLGEVVPGDLIKLAAGDMIPADLRLINAKDLFLTQASLTGESLPVEKVDVAEASTGRSPLEYGNLCFLGTSVESGSAIGVVACTGKETYFGTMASTITTAPPPTSFDKGISKFTWLMIRFMVVMVPLVFLINAFTKHTGEESFPLWSWPWFAHRNWGEAFMFSLAVAVGLTPEMLPMIVSVCLSKGALAMSRKKVIVKRLNSIQNFGAMDVLCTDKTGTLTLDHVILERHCDVVGENSRRVITDAYLISHFQTGLKNVLDRAILDHNDLRDHITTNNYQKLDELPFDFSRRMMSVVVEGKDGIELLCKGAPEAVFPRCKTFELDGDLLPIDQLLIEDLKEEYLRLSADGFRVLAVAGKRVEKRAAYSKEDENDLVLKGYVAFLDPPKDTAREAIEALHRHGITVKVLTGDNDLVTKKICREVGLPVDRVLLGTQVEAMSDEVLAKELEQVHVLARLSPMHKQRVILALQKGGHVVGFMGDGINDAPALRAADVGISVDTAVDIAKESADVILLEKSLMVLEEGVLEGRKVFANIVKYVRMGASSNFGNMFSVLGASALFPFIPMRPIQVLTNNLFYDISQVPIPTDEVDAEQITKPRPWNIDEIKRFILFIGPISSIFDYTTYFMMWLVFKCQLVSALLPPPGTPESLLHQLDPSKGADSTYAAALFQTGWFVESLMTQTLIIHIIRTNKVPFLQSRASWPVIVTTALVMVAGAYLPLSPIGGYLGFAQLPALYWPLLMVTLLAYMVLTQLIKRALLRKGWI